MKHSKHSYVFFAALAGLAAGCASTAHLDQAEELYCAGQYEEARASARSEIDEEEDPAEIEKAGYILDNLYAGSTALMCGDPEGAAEDFRHASDGIADQEESTFGSGYPTRTYDATMAENYRALALWMQGETDSARVAFRLVADAQDKAEERFESAIRDEQEELEKRKAEAKEEVEKKAAEEGGDAENAENAEGEGEDAASTLASNPQIAEFQGSFDDWEVYADFQIPSAWFLDALFALSHAEDASDLEHASFAARKAISMQPTEPGTTLFALAESRADGKLSASALDGLFVVVFDNGLGPTIEEKRFDLPFPYDGAIYNISFALPTLVKREVAYPKLVVRDGPVALGETVPISDFDRVAVREFKGRLPGIIASQILEATTKLVIQIVVVKIAEDQGGAMAKFLASAAMSALSSAVTGTDTRHWNLLPKEVQAWIGKKPATGNRTVGLWIPGGVEPLATVDLPESGLSVVYVRIPAPGLPPFVTVLDSSGN